MPAMSSTERIYLRMERPGFPCDIAGINVLEPSPEGALPFEAVRAVFDQRRHQSPLLTLMLAPAPLGIGEDRWTQAASLDIDAHVHHRQVPPPGDMQALLATVLEVSKDPLDRSRPLWEAWYLSGMAGGAAALLLRTHHAAIDGMGVMQLHRVLFDTEPTTVDLGAALHAGGGPALPVAAAQSPVRGPQSSGHRGGHDRPDRQTGGRRGARDDGGKTGPCGPRHGAQAGLAAAAHTARTRWRCRSCPGTSPHRPITRRSRCSTGTWTTRASRWPSSPCR